MWQKSERPGVIDGDGTPQSEGLDVRPPTILAALGTALAATLAAAVPAQAGTTSATIDQKVATLNLDGADDNVTVSVAAGLLVHNQATGGLASVRDWNSAQDGEQTVAADDTFTVVVNGGGGNDAITVIAKDTEIEAAELRGDAGDDVVTGADSKDTLEGGEGNDRLTGGKQDDIMTGGLGNDTMVWNQGDNSDLIDGNEGNDATEVNGAPTLGDTFVMDPEGALVKFRRTNLGQFTLQSATERFEVNGLGGDDSLTANDGVGARTLLSVDGGAGVDTVNGSEGADLILGGEASDALNGGGGDDRIVGDRGADTMNGGPGDDTLVWNNGDGSDVANGDAGRDDVEVNGHPALGDTFVVNPDGARTKFERTNIVPFSIDAGSSETLHANGLGGNDTATVGSVGRLLVTAAGGSGNDSLTGGTASETLLGGSGEDTIVAGAGLDVVSGDDGNDKVDVRDRSADVARGGDGNDSVVADNAALDTLDGFEVVSRTPVVTPPPVKPPAEVPPPARVATQPVVIRGGTVKVNRTRRTAAIKVFCPAASPGNCTGSLELKTAGRVKLAGLRVVLHLAEVRYDVAAGKSKTLKVKLPSGLRRVADRKGRIKVRALATTGEPGQTVSSSKRLTLAVGKSAARR